MLNKFQRPLNLHQFTLTKGDRTKKDEITTYVTQKKRCLAVVCIASTGTGKLCYHYVRTRTNLVREN